MPLGPMTPTWGATSPDVTMVALVIPKAWPRYNVRRCGVPGAGAPGQLSEEAPTTGAGPLGLSRRNLWGEEPREGEQGVQAQRGEHATGESARIERVEQVGSVALP